MGAPTRRVRAQLDRQVRALIQHADGVRGSHDPEHVHQLRVAVRRARAVLKATSTHKHLQAELKWLGGVCADVRDADVLLARLRASAAGFDADERAAVDRLLDGVAEQRRGARRHLLAALRSTRFRALVSSLAEAARAVEPAAVALPHRKFAKALARLGDDPGDEDLHRLRIRGKRLRYAAELRGKKAKPLVKATKKLQGVLGEHQDAAVAVARVRALLAAMGGAVPVDVALVAGRLIEREHARRAESRARWRAAAAEVGKRAAALSGRSHLTDG
ncbi:CHAD domain-containing protein [Actinokineospora sp. NPDC004072]